MTDLLGIIPAISKLISSACNSDSDELSSRTARILLDNPQHTYYAGQDLNGHVEFSISRPIKIKGILVQFKGKAKTSWTERTSKRDSDGKYRTVTKYYSGKEEHLKVAYYLIGNKNGPDIDIPLGTVSYDFRCSLPTTLPTSFEGEHGSIRYKVKVVVESAYVEKKTEIAFNVVNAVDLNSNPAYKEPIHLQLEKNFCCWCCASDPLSVDVRAPVSGYSPGQTIPFEVYVENHSDVEVYAVKILLRKIITFKSTYPSHKSKVSKSEIAEARKGGAPAGATREFELQLQIPTTPATNLVKGSIIDLDYEIKVILEVSGAHTNLTGKKYITIGSVPLVTLPQFPQTGDQMAMPSAPLLEMGGPTFNDNSPSMPYGLNSTQSYPHVQDMVNGGANVAQVGFLPTPYPVQSTSMPMPYS